MGQGEKRKSLLLTPCFVRVHSNSANSTHVLLWSHDQVLIRQSNHNTCIASAKGKGGGGKREREKKKGGGLGRREVKGALAVKIHKTPCIYVQNLDVKC